MPRFDGNELFGDRNHQADFVDENLVVEQDLLMERILENINTIPIGQVLKKIASLPEIRKEKVLEVRRQLNKGKYDLNGRLDIALERVLELLTTQ